MSGKVSEACPKVPRHGSEASGRDCLFVCMTALVFICLCVKGHFSHLVFLDLSTPLYLLNTGVGMDITR